MTDDSVGAAALGLYLKTTRQGLEMSLRAVEKATNSQVSNAYLSQLETGKVAKPSAHVLHQLAAVYGVDYQELMTRAGYLNPATAKKSKNEKHGRAATFAIENLDPDEEKALREYLAFIRSKRKT